MASLKSFKNASDEACSLRKYAYLFIQQRCKKYREHCKTAEKCAQRKIEEANRCDAIPLDNTRVSAPNLTVPLTRSSNTGTPSQGSKRPSDGSASGNAAAKRPRGNGSHSNEQTPVPGADRGSQTPSNIIGGAGSSNGDRTLKPPRLTFRIRMLGTKVTFLDIQSRPVARELFREIERRLKTEDRFDNASIIAHLILQMREEMREDIGEV